MANTPKKVKDPTEVALSAIQEALNISDTTVDTNRNSMGNEMEPPTISSTAAIVAVVAIDPTGRNLPATIPRAQHRNPMKAVTSRGSPTDWTSFRNLDGQT